MEEQSVRQSDRVRSLRGDHCGDFGTVLQVKWDAVQRAYFATVRWDTGIRFLDIHDTWSHRLDGNQLALIPSSAELES